MSDVSGITGNPMFRLLPRPPGKKVEKKKSQVELDREAAKARGVAGRKAAGGK